MVNKALRIVLYSIFTISLLFVVPFNNIYASVQSQIVPTFSSSTSQWNGHLYVTNFSDGTDNQASSTLSFTFDDDYYGMIYFDGYGPSNQYIANYAVCFIAAGYGEYRYSYYQNGLINITNVTINIVNVVKPQSSVDLTQIITLLTAIENDTSSIDNVLDTTLAQIRLVLAELIESNGYLETLTKLRHWNIPFESFGIVNSFLIHDIEMIEILSNNYFNYPIFNYKLNDVIDLNNSTSGDYVMIMAVDRNIQNVSGFNSYFSFNKQVTVKSLNILFYQSFIPRSNTTVIKAIINIPTSGYLQMTNIYQDLKVVPIYWNKVDNKNLSTDFALTYGLSNKLLDDLDMIANGTNASSDASSQNDQANSQLQQDSNTLFQQEDSFKQNMNSAMQNIDTTFTLNNFGQSFMTSAQWVRTQYETLTNNTPFASLITFSLLLGLALIVVGKVYK